MIFSFSTRTSNNILFFIALGNKITTNKGTRARSGPPIRTTTSPISITREMVMEVWGGEGGALKAGCCGKIWHYGGRVVF
jgi:hypothetical protein